MMMRNACVQTNSSITAKLQAFAGGDKSAFDTLLPELYAELRKMAEGHMRRESGIHTLQPTALVNELYTRVVNQRQHHFASRAHFMALASRVMRQILVDHSRSRAAAKRGANVPTFSLDESSDKPLEQPAGLLPVHEALDALERFDAQKARLIEMQFFGGLSAEESASVLGIPAATVRKELRFALAWMKSQLDAPSPTASTRGDKRNYC